jgi:AbrB family looped-hinge helix DNA binding protein
MVDMANKVGERFQITIDKVVRERLGIKPGDQAIEWVEADKLVVSFVRPNNASMLGIVKHMTGREIEPITDWQALYDRAWAARSAEIMEVLEQDSERHRSDTRPTDEPST